MRLQAGDVGQRELAAVGRFEGGLHFGAPHGGRLALSRACRDNAADQGDGKEEVSHAGQCNGAPA